MAMRTLAIVVAAAAAVALSGCMGTHAVDEEDPEGADPEVAFVLLGAAIIAGIVLVAINLSNAGGSRPSQPPMPGRPPQPPEQADWQPVEEVEDGEVPPRTAARSAPKQARRRAP